MKVAVIGCGNVGFSHLAWLQKRGFDVVGYDTDSKIQKKISTFIGESCVAYNLKSIASCDSIHICVPTESSIDGSADMSIYEEVITELVSVLDKNRPISVIQRSTCPPGSADKYSDWFNQNISYGVNPSFLRKASIWEDTENPERVAFGGNGISIIHLEEIYRGVDAPRYVTESRTSVELLKYVENSLDAMLISYWNEILEYAVSLKIETTEVFRLLERIGDREKFRIVARVPGKAFGLWCLPKDLRALIIEMKKKEISPSLIEGILNTNIRFEQQSGIGLIPAQQLWVSKNSGFCILEEGKKQINEYVEGEYGLVRNV